MSFDDNRKSITEAAAALRQVQEEISNLAFDDSTRRDRVTGLLNNVNDGLVAVHDRLVEDEDKDRDAEASGEAREVRESDSEQAHNRPIAESRKEDRKVDAPRPGNKR
jgi:hypothetical protein